VRPRPCPTRALSLYLLLSAAAIPGLSAAPADNFGIQVAMQERSAATFYVPGEIVGFGAVELLVDTGSGYTTINQRTLDALVLAGATRYIKDLRGIMADGSTRVVPVYAIERMRIGGHCWLDDVEAAVLPGESRQILGLSALRKAAPFIFSIDPPALSLSRCGKVQPPPLPASAPALAAGRLAAPK
jgi:predicted aspartyl protease